jgi:hypothetical protein
VRPRDRRTTQNTKKFAPPHVSAPKSQWTHPIGSTDDLTRAWRHCRWAQPMSVKSAVFGSRSATSGLLR